MAIKEIEYKESVFRISYDILNLQKRRSILFLHGWGSNKEIMKLAFKGTFKDFKHIYIDLPGFGNSENSMVLNTYDYAAIVDSFLQEIECSPYAVIGHSFGGKIAVLIKPRKLILLSSAGILLPKPFKVKAKIALFKLIKPIGGKWLRELFISKDASGMPQNMYETFKNVVDEDFKENFKSCDSSTLLCWGFSDSSTPLEAGRAMEKIIPNARLEVFDGDHYFFLDKKERVAKVVEDFLEDV